MTPPIAIDNHLASWPASLTPLREFVKRYAAHGIVERPDGALQIARTPWIATEAFALVLFPPAQPEWIDAFDAATGSTIPAAYREVLQGTNGCFAFGLGLYGLPPGMQGASPRLNRATLQPLDLGLANRSWIREFRTRPDGLYVGGREWSREANSAYFLTGDGTVRAALRTGEVVGTWPSLEAMLTAELPLAEARAREEAPAGAWSDSASRPAV